MRTRLGWLDGDAFVAVCPQVKDPVDCVPLSGGVLHAVSRAVIVDGHSTRATASLGVIFHRRAEAMDADQLLRQADQAMYQAKLSGGGNRQHCFDTAKDRSERGWREALEHIRQALGAERFVLQYQPKVNLHSGAETLIRREHPERGLLLTARFLPVIERHPLVALPGKWVLDKVPAQTESWLAVGLDIQVSVKLAARQLRHQGFVARLGELLGAHAAIETQRPELELLESSALDNIDQVSQVMRECRRMGVSFALEDFGTGATSCRDASMTCRQARRRE